jgi:uncharacterized membrane protein
MKRSLKLIALLVFVSFRLQASAAAQSEATDVKNSFLSLSEMEKAQRIKFLKSL